MTPLKVWSSKLFHVGRDRWLISTSMNFPKRTHLSSPNHYTSQCGRNKDDYFTVRNCFALTVIVALVFSENLCSFNRISQNTTQLHLTLSRINFRSSLLGRGNTKWTASGLTQPVVKQQGVTVCCGRTPFAAMKLAVWRVTCNLIANRKLYGTLETGMTY